MQARDILGVNVLFNNANLNEMSVLMTKIAANISGSSDFIIKMDTDDFLTVYDNSTKAITTSFTEYLSGFAKHENHPLRILGGDSRIGYKQNSIPMKDVCEKDIHSTPDKFPLFPFKLIGNGIGKGYKAVYDSRQPFVGRRVSLGGHASEGSVGWTNFGIVHFHYRCAEIDAENSKQVIERHNFISITDSIHETKVKLGKMHGCNATEDMCRTCDFKGRFASWHKTSFYLKWLDCKEEAKEEYYRSHEAAEHNYNTPLVDAMKYSHAKFDV